MGSLSVSSCRCCMFVSCVHPVAVLNASFCMTCSLSMLVEDAIGNHYRRGSLQSRSHNCFIGSHDCLLLFTPSCCSECFYDLFRFVCLYGGVVDVWCTVCESKVRPRTFGYVAMGSCFVVSC